MWCRVLVCGFDRRNGTLRKTVNVKLSQLHRISYVLFPAWKDPVTDTVASRLIA
jgi:hypothetical protein